MQRFSEMKNCMLHSQPPVTKLQPILFLHAEPMESGVNNQVKRKKKLQALQIENDEAEKQHMNQDVNVQANIFILGWMMCN